MLGKFKEFFTGNKAQKNSTILIVDDNPTDRKLIERTVENLGYRVITAKDGKEAIEKTLAEKPHLILSDCNMPEMGGIEMCKRLLESEQTQSIPIIFLTSENTPKNIVDCFELGAHGHMVKPINPKILASQIDDIFKEYLNT